MKDDNILNRVTMTEYCEWREIGPEHPEWLSEYGWLESHNCDAIEAESNVLTWTYCPHCSKPIRIAEQEAVWAER